MIKRSLSFALLALSIVLTNQSNVSAQTLYGGVEYVYLQRAESGGGSRDLIYGDNTADENIITDDVNQIDEVIPQTVALNAADLDFGGEMAMRAIVGATLPFEAGRLELSYLTMPEDFQGNATLTSGDYSLGTQLQNNNQHTFTEFTPANNVSSDNTMVAALLGFGQINTVAAQRDSNFSQFEFNYIGQLFVDNWHFDPIVGVRGVYLDEALRMDFVKAANAVPSANAFEAAEVGPASYSNRAENWMVGPQVGGEIGYTAIINDLTAVDFNILGKGGLLLNSVTQEINITNAQNGGLQPDAPDGSETAFSPFAELAVKAVLNIDFVEIQVGYEALLISNVNLGGVPNNLWIGGADTLSADDTVFLHGFNAGGTIHF